ncbi:hypothetical protein J437_LFUL000953 [Ladona fulva]|uniref:Uncharacterized protein n=1 Tax=Ladona fulva TaxID=123851 RepID=A0A8K0P0Z0_LADFU|nr:hypothetical protein J437_LFUL000953 [Ladona fulva]
MLKYSKILERGLLLFYIFAVLCYSYGHAGYCSCQKHILCLYKTWDDFLMKTSQRWADQCTYEHTDTKCRIAGIIEHVTGKSPFIADDNTYFGENLAIRTYSSESMYSKNSYLDLIKAWYDEVKDFPPALVDQYEP